MGWECFFVKYLEAESWRKRAMYREKQALHAARE